MHDMASHAQLDAPKTLVRRAWALLRWIVMAQAAAAALAVLAMIAVTCVNVLLAKFGRPLKGADDLLYMAGGVAVAFSLPYTTAVKGHVAIEYFFHGLHRHARIAVDTLMRTLGIGLMSLLCWRSWLYGMQLHRVGEVSMSGEIPLFWLPMVIAAGCATTAAVILYNMLHPGREMIKP